MRGMSQKVIIVGGGVVGAACAYYLHKAGAEVTVIDQHQFGRACSHANCGFISPSHILPLCQPGAIRASLPLLLRRNSPFTVKWRLDFELLRWFWRFARQCNQQQMLQAGAARQALLNSSRELYQSLIDSGELSDCDFEARGLLFVFDSKKQFDHHAEVDRLLQREFGLAAKPFAGEEFNALEPALRTGFGGGWLYECDAHLRPDKLMTAWKQRLQAAGVELIEHCEFQSLTVTEGSIRSIETSQGAMAADQVVFATGAWTGRMQAQLKAKLPIQPGKGYSITMPRPSVCPRYPLIFEEHRVAITPWQSGYRIGSTMEFAGFDPSIRQARLDLLMDGARHYLREPIAEPIQETWYGWRPMSADGVPIIGRLPKFKNAWVASGHSMLGLSMGTATGKLIAELLTNQTPHVDPQPYRSERFS